MQSVQLRELGNSAPSRTTTTRANKAHNQSRQQAIQTKTKSTRNILACAPVQHIYIYCFRILKNQISQLAGCEFSNIYTSREQQLTSISSLISKQCSAIFFLMINMANAVSANNYALFQSTHSILPPPNRLMSKVGVEVPSCIASDRSTKRVVNSPQTITLKGIPKAPMVAKSSPSSDRNFSNRVAQRNCKSIGPQISIR